MFENKRGLMMSKVQSDFDLKVSETMIINSCNLELGNTIGQGKIMTNCFAAM